MQFYSEMGNKNPHCETTLTLQEETSLLNYIKFCCDKGFPLTVELVKFYAVEIVKKRPADLGSKVFGENGPSNGWWESFK